MVDQVKRQLAAALGDEGTRATAEALLVAADPAIRLALVSPAAALTDEVTMALLDLPAAAVAARPDGDEIRIDVRASAGLEAPVEAPEDSATARVSLRLPEALKAQVDVAARADGVSVNAWLGPRRPVDPVAGWRPAVRVADGAGMRSGYPAGLTADRVIRSPGSGRGSVMARELTTVPMSGPTALQVNVGHGAVSIAAREGVEEATVRLAPRLGAVEMLDHYTVQMRGSTLVVAADIRQGGLADLLSGWWQRRGAVDAAVEVPTGTPVTVVSAAERITLTGRCGTTDITAGGGHISIESVDGDLQLRYGNAECHIGPVAGAVTLKGGNGPAHLAEVGGAFDGQLGRGDLELAAAHGEVRARIGYGAVRIPLMDDSCDIATGYGDITVGIPAGVAARVDAATGLGQVRSGLPVDDEPIPGSRKVTIRARTGKGDISLLRAAAGPEARVGARIVAARLPAVLESCSVGLTSRLRRSPTAPQRPSMTRPGGPRCPSWSR